jgi:hypothetical protein
MREERGRERDGARMATDECLICATISAQKWESPQAESQLV